MGSSGDNPHAPRISSRRDYAAVSELARDLKAAISLAQFVEDMIPTTHLTRTGDHWTGHCPIPTHDDAARLDALETTVVPDLRDARPSPSRG